MEQINAITVDYNIMRLIVKEEIYRDIYTLTKDTHALVNKNKYPNGLNDNINKEDSLIIEPTPGLFITLTTHFTPVTEDMMMNVTDCIEENRPGYFITRHMGADVANNVHLYTEDTTDDDESKVLDILQQALHNIRNRYNDPSNERHVVVSIDEPMTVDPDVPDNDIKQQFIDIIKTKTLTVNDITIQGSDD